MRDDPHGASPLFASLSDADGKTESMTVAEDEIESAFGSFDDDSSRSERIAENNALLIGAGRRGEQGETEDATQHENARHSGRLAGSAASVHVNLERP